MKSHDTVRRKLKEFGLAYPEAHSKSPWPGHDELAVRNKTFAYLNAAGEPLSISCKLPLTGQMALTLPFASPTFSHGRPRGSSALARTGRRASRLT